MQYHAVLLLCSACLPACAAAAELASLAVTVTEEGQHVVFSQGNWQQRELAKRLPLDQPWPEGPSLQSAIQRFGLDRDTPPAKLPVPARIIGDVYLVGQDLPTNRTYLIDCGSEGVALIDPGYESGMAALLLAVEKCGFPRQRIRWVINTHSHVDHAMADRKFHDLGARILVHEGDAGTIEKGQVLSEFARKKSGIAEVPACPVDRRLADGEDVRLGNKSLRLIHTPGHTPGSSCFLLKIDGRNLLFSGDTLLYDCRLAGQGPNADNRTYLASLKKLKDYSLDGAPVHWDLLLPGHGVISLDRADMDVAKGYEMLQRSMAAGKVEAAPFTAPGYRERMFGRPATKFVASH